MKKDKGCKRTPNVANGNNTRNLNPSGALNNNSAANANGVAPDCEKGQIAVSSKEPTPAHSHKEPLSCLPKGNKQRGADAVGDRAGTATDSVKEKVCSFENLYKAVYICKRGVMWKDSVSGFVKNALANCAELHDDLMNDSYKLSKYNVFEVHEKKTRTIVSTRMRDRVVQRSLCDNYLTAELSKSFIYDNHACLPGKGARRARERLKCHLQRFYRKHGLDGWVLKVDIHDFFGSTPHSVTKEAVRKRVNDEWARKMVFDVIDSFNRISPDRGMGLGSQITQLVQLAVLDDIDHGIKERLRIKGYVRYMDDFILIHEDKDYLKHCLFVIENELSKLGLEINRKKTRIQPINNGIHFLGFSFRLTKTGKVVQNILSKNVRKEKRRLKKLSGLVKSGKMTRRHADECFKSWKSHAAESTDKRISKNMDAFYKNLFKEE